MMKNHHVQTSSTLAAREREEYNRARDEIDGIVDEEDMFSMPISERTNKLLLANMRAMLNRNEYSDDDPLSSLLSPSMALGYDDDVRGDWSTDYKW